MDFESKINIQYCFSKLEGLQLIIRTVVEFHLSYLGSARFFCRPYPDAHIKLSELLWLIIILTLLQFNNANLGACKFTWFLWHGTSHSSKVCFLSKDQIFWILFFRAGNAAIVIGLDTEQKFGILHF